MLGSGNTYVCKAELEYYKKPLKKKYYIKKKNRVDSEEVKIKCICGRELKDSSYTAHLNTQCHQDFINQKNKVEA